VPDILSAFRLAWITAALCAGLVGTQAAYAGSPQSPASGQVDSAAPDAATAQHSQVQKSSDARAVAIAVVDENGAVVAEAQVTVEEPGMAPSRLTTDFNGHGTYSINGATAYVLRVQKPGFYATVMNEADPEAREVQLVLRHEQMLVQQVDVSASAPEIDTQQVSDETTLALPEIVNIPYPTSRDIRNLLQFFPGVVQDNNGDFHVAGSEVWATLDLLDNFDIRSPISGRLAMRFSADAVRSIDQETTRYPVRYGRSTGGVMAFFTGMGDNKFRFNATDFLPSFRQVNGIRFDKTVPRVTFSGPLKRNHAWFFDGLEVEYDNIYIKELPANADTDEVIRGSNLFRVQANLTPRNILNTGLLFNEYHSPYDGISPLTPQASTTNTDILAWLPYGRDQHSFHNGALLDVGLGVTRFRDGYEPHAGPPYALTPELSQGAYFENLTSRSQRVEANAIFYFPPRHWMGEHDLQVGVDLDRIGYDEAYRRAPVDYLAEDHATVLRQSTFPQTPPFTRHNVESGLYVQDRYTPRAGLLIEPGLRVDFDEIISDPLVSPRLAVVYSPPRWASATKISAGWGVYYEHTQLEYLTRALAGIRYDTYYAADGVTPPPPLNTRLVTNFTYNDESLREAYALNWSVGIEQKVPGAIYLKANYIQKEVEHEFTYVNQNAPALWGTYTLTNQRQDDDSVTEVEARHTFRDNYTLFGAYTHARAHTNAAIDYVPTISYLGPQQSGPLAWDTPNRVLSWGWLPFYLPWFRKNWDFVYTFDRHTGFPFTAVDADRVVVGRANGQRFPAYESFSPGLEWRFHFHGMYLGLRGIMENALNKGDYTVVNNVVDSPQYGTFSEPLGRAITARIRLIESKK
jgi:hypothetical protein